MGMALLCTSAIVGCAGPDKASWDSERWVSEETVNRVGPPSRATSRTVRCGCDADGDLHVQAPQGSKVVRPEDAAFAAEAEVVLPDDEPPRPIRRTKSLGFIGDNKLGQSHTYGGPWAVPDALLPPHRHVEPRYGGYGGYGGYGRAYGSYGSYRSPPTYR